MRRSLILVLAGFALLAFAFSLVVPPFETPDEMQHYGFARQMAQEMALPVQSVPPTGPWEHEGSQAPLYYTIVGVLTSAIDQSDFPAISVRNPRANIGNPLFPGNKNYVLHSAADRDLQGSNLALHVGRWFSLLLGLTTVAFTWQTARLAFGSQQRLALLAAAFAATLPQYAFVSGSLTNDALVTALGAVTVWWLARLLAKPTSAPIRWWEWAILGAVLGLAALSKLQGLGLFLLSALAGIMIMVQRRDWRLPLRSILPVALPPLLIAGWWYVRNYRLYGDWTGSRYLLEINGNRVLSMGLADWWLEFRGLRYSFWGLFGWFNLVLPSWLYLLFDVLTVVALVGSALALARVWRRGAPPSPQRNVLLLAGVWSALSVVLLVIWTLDAMSSQGRLLFPALSTLAILFVLGMDYWIGRLRSSTQNALWGAYFVLMVGISGYALGWLLPGAYRADAPITALPATVQPVGITFGDERTLELVGVDLPAGRFRSGDAAPVTLYLRARSPQVEDYQLFLQLLDEKGREIANITTHPGWGRNPTTLWQAGALYADRYPLRITTEIAPSSPLSARLYVGFTDPATEEQGYPPLPAFDADGNAVTPFVGAVVVEPAQPATVATVGAAAHGATLGGVIRVEGVAVAPAVTAGTPLTVTVLYAALGAPATEYTAFVHLMDAAGNKVAGFDQAPAPDRFPTQQWRAGDAIAAIYVLPLPPGMAPGEYAIWSGLYETASGGAVRLPVSDNAGLPSGDGQVLLGTVRVE